MERRRLLATVLAVSLPAAAAAGAKPKTEVDYAAVLLSGKKIGYARTTRTVDAGRITNEELLDLQVGRMGFPLHVQVETATVETAAGKPVAFRCRQDMAISAMTIEGTVKADGTMEVKTTSAGRTTTTTAEWPKGALMAEGLSRLSRKTPLKEGTTFSTRVFDPTCAKAFDAALRVGKKKRVDLLGRVVMLTEVKTTLGTRVGKITETSYVDDNWRTLKSITDVMGMKLEILACSRQFAMSKNDRMDFFKKSLIASPGELKGLAKAESATYHLAPKGIAKLKVPGLDDQTVQPGSDGQVIVTVRRLDAPAGRPIPYRGKDPSALGALKSTRFVQSDRKEVIALARKAVGKTQDAAEAARRIRDFVYKYITKKNFSVGYATAAEVAESREGDCSEHAVLATAMCRAVGIPAQVVIGATYVPEFGGRKHIFGPHAWFRVHLGGKWIQMDAALPDGWDPGHLALAAGDGDIDDFFQLVNVLGCFTIKKVVVSP